MIECAVYSCLERGFNNNGSSYDIIFRNQSIKFMKILSNLPTEFFEIDVLKPLIKEKIKKNGKIVIKSDNTDNLMVENNSNTQNQTEITNKSLQNKEDIGDIITNLNKQIEIVKSIEQSLYDIDDSKNKLLDSINIIKMEDKIVNESVEDSIEFLKNSLIFIF